MKPFIAALIATAVSLSAGTIDVSAQQLCRRANFHNLQVTTATGETIEGLCVSVNADEIAISVKGKPVTMARDRITRILLISSQHQLRYLGRNVHDGLRWGVKSLLSPAAVVGIVTIPATLAWGAVAAPFCIIGDLVAKGNPDQEVNLL